MQSKRGKRKFKEALHKFKGKGLDCRGEDTGWRGGRGGTGEDGRLIVSWTPHCRSFLFNLQATAFRYYCEVQGTLRGGDGSMVRAAGSLKFPTLRAPPARCCCHRVGVFPERIAQRTNCGAQEHHAHHHHYAMFQCRVLLSQPVDCL